MFLSVVTTVFNSMDTVERCVESVVSQLPEDCEYVLVDDGSTDGTGQFIDEKFGHINGIRIIHQANTGSAGSFNTAVAHSQGMYVLNLDDDDYLFPGTLGQLIEKLHEYQPDVMQFWYRPYKKEGGFRDPVVFETERFLGSRQEMLVKTSPFRLRFSIISTTWTCKAIRRDLMAGIEATGPGKGADSLFMRQVLIRANSFLIYPLPTIALYEDPDSVSRSKDGDTYARQNLDRWINSIPFFQIEGKQNERPLLGADQVFYSYRDFCIDEISKDRLNRREAKKISLLIRSNKRMIMPKHKKKTTAVLDFLWLHCPVLAYRLVCRPK